MNWKFYIFLSSLTICPQIIATTLPSQSNTPPPKLATVSQLEANKTACSFHYTQEQYQLALESCRTAAEQADPESQYILGQIYLNGNGTNPDYGIALKWFEKAAQKNHAAANLEMGKAFATGIISPIHYLKSYEYFKRAALQNNHEAQFLLALSYQNGFGVPMNYEQANIWFQKANLNGFPVTEYIDIPVRKASIQDSSNPTVPSGHDIYLQAMAYNAWDKQQEAQKIQGLIQAANLNHPQALYQLGLHYFQGRAVAQDDAKAYGYLIQSAKASYQPAQSLLAWMNALGLGVTKNLIQAANWFIQSNQDTYQTLVLQNTPNRTQIQKNEDINPSSVTKSRDQSNIAAIKKSAHEGNDKAQAQIGYLYYQGKGVPQNLVEAYAWLNLAAKSGSEQALAQRETIASKMTTTQVTKAQNRSLALFEAMP